MSESVQVALTHRTTYDFAHAVQLAPHVVRLRPAPHCRTPIEGYRLDVQPPARVDWQQDPFGNWLARLVFAERTDRLEVTVSMTADLVPVNPFDFFLEPYAATYPFAYETGLAEDLASYLRPVEGSGGADAWRHALPQPPEGTSTVEFLGWLNTAVNGDVAYSVRMEAGVQSPDATLERRIGSCRDSAWLLVSLLRQYGLAARFVSGYLVQIGNGDAETGDTFDLHAWAEVYVPGAGWIGLDPTSALFAGEGHLPLSATPHPRTAAPIEGTTEPTEVSFTHTHEIVRVGAPVDDRVTVTADAGHLVVRSTALQRPEVLGGLVAYWQRHPALSYLFADTVGPDGAAPRADEVRDDALAELEIALAQEGDPIDGTELRLEAPGVLALRAFTVPADPGLAEVQALLAQSLVELVRDHPASLEVRRWGSALHDEFLLLDAVARDLAHVTADLRAAGLAVEDAGLETALAHRFPHLGTVRFGDVRLELRRGLEPLRLLAAEPDGTRFVDTSLERLQVSVRGIDPTRHLVACQGVPVPLRATGTADEHVAGVRLRTWLPPVALHPGIGPHLPLRFEVVDTVTGTSLGGATYDGQSVVADHTSGRRDVATMRERARRAEAPEHPHTLDLRRVP